MNLELLETFGQNYPQEFDGILDCMSIAVTCSFNKYGTLLAVGCNDGRIVIWDFSTRGIAKIIMAHIHPICSLSWSRNCQKILSASTDNNVCNWNVSSGEREDMYKFPSLVQKVQYHPRKKNLFIACPLKHAVVLIDIDGDHKVVPINDDTDQMIIASFDRRGEYIYTGNAHGKVLVFTCPDLEVKASFNILPGTTGIRSIEFARRGDYFLLNCSDRIIRVYNTNTVLNVDEDEEVEPIQKLQDLVNKTMWKSCCFSGDGEYVCAGSARQHALYIWERSVGNLVKILHGTKGEFLLHISWHPVRAIITSVSSGLISVWAQSQVENWSAFAPDFKELDENVDFEERESEFDIEDEDKSMKNDSQQSDEDIEVDVENVEPIAAYCSSDEEGIEDYKNALLFLPMAPEDEDPTPLDPDMLPPALGTETPKPRTIYINLDNELVPLLKNLRREEQFK